MQCVRGGWDRAQSVCRVSFDLVLNACMLSRAQNAGSHARSQTPALGTTLTALAHAHSRTRPATATTGRYCGKDCQRIHWKSGHKHECDDLKTLHDLQAEFAEMQGLDGFENYNPLHRPTLSDRFRVRD